MVESYDSPEEIEEQLAIARAALRSFERGAGYSRLLQRLRTASPAHPVLLARFFCMALSVLCILAGLVVLTLPFVSKDLARQLVMFESVVSFVPYGVPAIPAVFAMLAAVMAVAWFLFTVLALASGRDAQMLPWEQREHQKLVNDVTRLTTQRAVMQRIQSTPAGSRPRLSSASSTYEPPSRFGSSEPRLGASGPSNPGFGGLSSRTPGIASRAGASGGFSRTPTPSYTPYQGTSSSKGSSPGGFGRPSYGASEPPAPTPTPQATGPQGGLDSPGTPTPSTPGGFGPPAPRLQAAGPQGTGLPGSSPQTAAPTSARAPSRAGSGFMAQQPELPDLQEPPITASPADSLGGWRPAPEAPEPGADVLLEPLDPPAPADPVPESAPVLGRIRPPEGFEAPPSPGAFDLLPPPGVPVSEQPTEIPSNGMVGFGDYDDEAFRAPQQPTEPAPHGGIRLGSAKPFGGLAEPQPTASPPAQFRSPLSAASPQRSPSQSLPHPPQGPVLAMPPEDDATEDFLDPQEPLEAEVVFDDELFEAESTGILSRARAGAFGSRATPYGSAGRIRPASAPLGKSTRGGTPLGAKPSAGVALGAKPSLAAAPSLTADRSGGLFSTPRPAAVSDEAPTQTPLDAIVVLDDEEEVPTFIANSFPSQDRKVPVWESIPDRWLREALTSAEHLVRTFPDQAHIEYSQEPNLPFTLVISQATPAMAVRAMVNFVEFLASIYTPPRARIELIHVAHLDRSFHKNVEAALEPYFANNVVVEPNPGRVDIQFTDPDPGWGQYPMLPMR